MKMLRALTTLAFSNGVFSAAPPQSTEFYNSYKHAFTSNDIITRDIAIIGGGSAGTYAAIRLKDMNQTTVVIEKDVVLGGQTDTYVDKDTGIHVNVGVEVFHNISLVKEYFARLNVLLTPAITTPSTPPVLVDFDTGLSVPEFVSASPSAIGEALTKYIGILSTNFSYLQSGYFLPDPVPEELLLPFGEFATNHGLQAAVQTINSFIQNDGDIWNVPTVQILKACDITLVQSALTGFLTTASGDNQDLYTSAAKVLGTNVLYDSTVIYMDRSVSGRVRLVVRTPSGLKLVQAKSLIVTIPPMLDHLDSFDLSKEEVSIFSKFRARGYYAGIFKHSGISNNVQYTNIGTKTPFNLLNLPGIFQIQPIGIPGQHKFDFGTLDFRVSSQSAQQMVVQQIQQLQTHGVFPADITEFLFFTNHSPFRLFVDVEDIKNGFYRDLYGLQGQHSTFWTGAAWITQDSSLIWNFTEALLPSIISFEKM